MPHWLARPDHAAAVEQGHMARFDARFWTVNFPRPMMASTVTTGPGALRVDAVFYNSDDLAGLIWESEDRWDHPLLAYETVRDYSRLTLRFHWRSTGLMPLDAVNGPTLTIEGRDAAGKQRSWYVRLWNYAVGTPQDAAITLPFQTLAGGFLLPGEADPVHPKDIDRMFISLVPPGYTGEAGRLAQPAEAWVEISDITCDGERAVIGIADAMLPEHALRMATGYDDAYNQSPERLLRQIRALGYRGIINHYVGMSHYFRLESSGPGLYVSLAGGTLNAPCSAWHRDFAARALAMGFETILSLSFELFDAHCWNDWKQRAENGDPALTGWNPPSTLLSPAHGGAMGYLRAVGRAFAAIQRDAGQAVRFQIGEPWWWIMPDRRICLYDAAAWNAFGSDIVSIPSIDGAKTAAQQAMLDRAGEMLAAATAALADAVRDEAGSAGATLYLLVYLPTVLDAAAPDARRANVPVGWAAPAFDVLQLEDYDWTVAANHAGTESGVAAMTARLGYPLAEQEFFVGFVLKPEEEAQWQAIARAIDLAEARTPARNYVWALPQVARDGFTYFQLEEDAMRGFDDVRFPIAIGRHATVTSEFSTGIVTTLSGRERRTSDWADARLAFDAGPGVRSDADAAELISFFRARRGAAIGFRFTDPSDHSSAGMTDAPGPFDQRIGTGDGLATDFPLVKIYGAGEAEQQRRITRPVAGTLRAGIGGVETQGFTLQPLGFLRFDTPPPDGAAVTAGFRFDVPVRFAEDRLEIAAATQGAADLASVPLIEVKE
ncbi:DUF2460 domain-containing protein [Novosphingopyxis sp. YJ-S2-01]|uniref:phage distal tail protein, Rcc01695 family n=1 Tax=Novosphingopyxis sp. YJ-S2-01 TaxID=2794021 RepID=UPI0018DDBDA8|nr:DUF2460 domain-containing protein [Novosphingopyxis sp. YJ-S2-01]